MNKILIVGSDRVWSLERIFLKHLRAMARQTDLFGAQNIFYSYYEKNILNKVLFRLKLSGIYENINEQLLETALAFQPDVIWVFKGMEVLPQTLQTLRQSGCILVNYNPDNPFIFSGYGSGNKNVIDSIGSYDMHFTYDKSIREKILREYKIPCALLPFGYELGDDLFNRCTRQQEVVRACFVGNPDKHRAAFLQQLAGNFEIDVYGHGWDKFVTHSSISVFPAVYGDDFWLTLYRYRLQLNLMRPHNPESHNMRSFEVPGVGGIGLFPATADHRSFFTHSKEVFLYENIDDCKKWIHALLGMTNAEAGEIRRSARQKSLQAGYSYYDRTRQFLAETEKLAV